MRIVFGVGTGFDRNGKMIGDVQAERLETAAVNYLSRKFGGVFKTDGKGGWIDDGGKLIEERGVQFIVETDKANGEEMAKGAGEALRELFNQTSVIVSVSPSTTVFISSEELSHV